MAFFRKLRDRMFKSSSKLDQGLEALIEDGAEEAVEEQAPVAAPGAGRPNRLRRHPPQQPLRLPRQVFWDA